MAHISHAEVDYPAVYFRKLPHCLTLKDSLWRYKQIDITVTVNSWCKWAAFDSPPHTRCHTSSLPAGGLRWPFSAKWSSCRGLFLVVWSRICMWRSQNKVTAGHRANNAHLQIGIRRTGELNLPDSSLLFRTMLITLSHLLLSVLTADNVIFVWTRGFRAWHAHFSRETPLDIFNFLRSGGGCLLRMTKENCYRCPLLHYLWFLFCFFSVTLSTRWQHVNKVTRSVWEKAAWGNAKHGWIITGGADKWLIGAHNLVVPRDT